MIDPDKTTPREAALAAIDDEIAKLNDRLRRAHKTKVEKPVYASLAFQKSPKIGDVVSSNDYGGQPYLYHVTSMADLPSILEKGLVAGMGQSLGKGVKEHATGRVFFSTQADKWYEEDKVLLSIPTDSVRCVYDGGEWIYSGDEDEADVVEGRLSDCYTTKNVASDLIRLIRAPKLYKPVSETVFGRDRTLQTAMRGPRGLLQARNRDRNLQRPHCGLNRGQAMIEHFRIAVSETTDRVVVSACAAMPSSCWGIYRRVAIVDVPTGVKVKAIDPRRMTVIATREKLNVGKTSRCAFDRAVSDLIAEVTPCVF